MLHKMVQSFHFLLQLWLVFSSGVVLQSLAIKVSTEYPDLGISEYVGDEENTAIDPEPSETTDDLSSSTIVPLREVSIASSDERSIRDLSSSTIVPLREVSIASSDERSIRDDENTETTLATVSEETTTECSGPSAPSISTTATDITVDIHWELVGCIPADLDSIEISVIGIDALGKNCEKDTVDHTKTVSTDESEATVTGLSAYHSYNVSVTVKTDLGQTATGASTFTTLQADHPAPNISTTATDTTVDIHWELVGCIPAELDSIEISVIGIDVLGKNCEKDTANHTQPVGTNEQEVTVTGLSAYHSYNVSVTVKTELGNSTSGASTFTTLQAVPPAPRVSTTFTDTTVNIQWELVGCIPAELDSIEISVIGIDALGENCEKDIADHTQTADTNESEVTITGLSAYHSYNVSVTIKTELGQLATGASTFTTLQAAPPVPVIEKTEAVSSSQFSITWNKGSECIPGVLNNYIVSVTFNRSEDSNCEFIEDPHNITVPVAGSNETYVHEEAFPYSVYHVAVAAETEGGTGQFSSEEEIITKEQVPPAPNVREVDAAASYFTVSWNLSGCINSTVKGFRISGLWAGSRDNRQNVCDFNGSETFQQEVDGDHTDYTFDQATPYSVYIVDVEAFIEGGQYGDPSSLNISTHEIDPPIPEISISDVDETSLKVSWELPVCIQANVTSYYVSLTPLGAKGINCTNDTQLHTKEVDSNQTEVEMSGLIPYHEYRVTVMVKTELGKNNSGETDATTQEAVPPAPFMNSISHGHTTALSIFWNMEGCISGNLMNYTILVNFSKSNNSECDFTQDPFTTVVPASDNLFIYENALPYSTYLVSVAAWTGRGQGTFSEVLTISTMEDFPPAPDITRQDFYSKHFIIDWSLPRCVNGSITNIHLYITPKGYIGNDSCSSIPESDFFITLQADTRTYTLDRLKPYSRYAVDIAAQTAAGEGNLASIVSQTEVYIPDHVRDLQVLDVAYNNSYATVIWEKPCRFNGQPAPYSVSVVGTHKYFESHEINKLVNVESVVIPDLMSEYQYSVTVKASNNYLSISDSIQFDQPANIPTYTGTLSAPDPYTTNDATTKAHFTLSQNFFDPRAGCVIHYAILVAEEGQDKEPKQGTLDGICSDWLKTENVVQVTPLCWNPFEANLTCMNSSQISFTIGANSSCSTDYCNAPLKPSTKYYIRVRGYTVSTFADTKYIMFETDSSVNAGLIAGIIVSFLVVGVGAILFLMYRRGTLPWPPGNVLNKTQVSVRPKPVPVTKFPVHCNRMLEIPSRIANEYQLLQTLSSDINATESFSTGQQPDNKRKNRYVNILPYDSTRVKLEPIAGDPYSDYINASFIKGYSGDIEYIATQGPKEETTSDFWHMVHQQGVKIIVMVTQLEENGKAKCYKYYPNLRDNMVMGDITVRCTTELNFPIYTSRTILLLKGDRQRSLVHLHFREWPDFGCPASADLMLQFVQVLRHQINMVQTGLTVVHCSAGVGRTGTLIAVDILLQHIKENKKVDIFGTVYKLRKQRINMVQSEPQYVYIYRCIKEAILEPSYLEIEKHSTSSLEPIYENIGNYTISNTSLINYEKLNENGHRTSSSETV